MSRLHFIWGFFKYLFRKNISKFAVISNNNIIDPNAAIYRGVKIKNSSLGAYSYIANNTNVENSIIGKFCSVADHCRIGMATHTTNNISTSPIFTERNNATKSLWAEKDCGSAQGQNVIIENDVWIGSHVLIKDGIKISNGAIIAAGAVVTKDVPPYAIVGGVPARIIKFRFSSDIVELLNKLEWWNLPEHFLKDNISSFQTDSITKETIEQLISLKSLL